MKRNDKYLSDKDLLQIYGITHPNENLGNRFTQQRVLREIKYPKKGEYTPIIKNPYIRWTLIIAICALILWFSVWLFTSYSDGLMSWERV